MATITIEIPEGKEAKWVNGVLTLVDEQPVEFKFKEGDKVAITHGEYKCYTIYLCGADNGKAYYWLIDENEVPHPKYPEDMLELYVEQPQDITERIKTFEDARIWCETNEQHDICRAYYAFQTELISDEDYNKDILAYLKLRIITCALNEGWKPTFKKDEERWTVSQSEHGLDNGYHMGFYAYIIPSRLYFKSDKLAEYAATQFKDIYMDFCYKGKE